MKENNTKFSLENAFKALDEIEYPEAGTKRNTKSLKESISAQPKTECLLEDYYDISSQEDLTDAQQAREDEIAKAKLARIEKIVDLDAETAEDILPSYVGKVVIQCPQCMEKFYYDPEDIVESDDPETVNVGEKCQHCGNEDGYMLIGKIAPVNDDELSNFEGGEEAPAEESELDLDFEETEETPEGEETEKVSGEEDLELEPVEETEEGTNESFYQGSDFYMLTEAFDDENTSEEITVEEAEENLTEGPAASALAKLKASMAKGVSSEVQEALNETLTESTALSGTTAQIIELAKIANKKGLRNDVDLDKFITDNNLDRNNLDVIIAEINKLPDPVNGVSRTLNRLKQNMQNTSNTSSTPKATNKPQQPAATSTAKGSCAATIQKLKNNLGESLTEAIDNIDKITNMVNSVNKGGKAILNTDDILKAKTAIKKAGGIAIIFDTNKANDQINQWLKGGIILINDITPEIKTYIDDSNTNIDITHFIGSGRNLHSKATYEDIALFNNYSDTSWVSRYTVKTESLTEATNDVSDAEFKNMLNSKTFKEVGREIAADGDIIESADKPLKENAASIIARLKANMAEGCEGAECADKQELDECGNANLKESSVQSILARLKAQMNEDVEPEAEIETEEEIEAEPEDIEAIDVLTDKLDAHGDDEFVTIAEKGQLDNPDAAKIEIEVTPEESETLADAFNDEDETEGEEEITELDFDELDEIDDESFEECISESLTNVYENVSSFALTNCTTDNKNLVVEGIVNFKSGNSKKLTYKFTEAKKLNNGYSIKGINEELDKDGSFRLIANVKDNKLISEKLSYVYTKDNALIEGIGNAKKKNVNESFNEDFDNEETNTITNVGVGVDELVDNGDSISGLCTIYSTVDGEEYEDDLAFTYNKETETATINNESGTFSEEEITTAEEILVGNIKTNVLGECL